MLPVALDKNGFKDLAEELGYNNPSEVANTWWDANIRYPWEEFKDVNVELVNIGIFTLE